jgi:hypothetical protein
MHALRPLTLEDRANLRLEETQLAVARQRLSLENQMILRFEDAEGSAELNTLPTPL